MFTSIGIELLDQSSEKSSVFSALEKTIHFMPHSNVSQRTDAGSKTNSSLPQIKCLLTLRAETSIISTDSNITDNIVRKVIKIFSVKDPGSRMEPSGTPALTGYSAKTFHPGPLEAIYYWKKVKCG